MRILKFCRIDLLIIKRFWYMWLLPLVFAVIYTREPSPIQLFGIVYGLFMGIILSTMPYSYETQEQLGFLQMLPARPGEQILAHFLSAAFLLTLGMLSGASGNILAIVGFRVLRGAGDAGAASAAGAAGTTGAAGAAGAVSAAGASGAAATANSLFWLFPIIFGAALVVTGIECLVLSAFRFESARIIQLLRIIPAFGFFFLGSRLSDLVSEQVAGSLRRGTFAVSIPILLICVAAYLALAWAGKIIAVRRGLA